MNPPFIRDLMRHTEPPVMRSRQQGRTLIELIIAMTIGLVIVIGVSSLYLSSSGTSRTANQLSTTEQAGQLAMLMIGDSLKMGAYGEIVGSDFVAQGQTLMDGPHLRGCTGTQFTNPFPAYVPPPMPLPAPDLSCSLTASGGDELYVRFQSRPVVAQMPAANADRISIFDCAGRDQDQAQILDSQQLRPGLGTNRRIVTNVYRRDPVTNTLDCRGYAGGGYATLVRDVVDFRVFYRFDDAGFQVLPSANSNYVPLGGSIRDASYINGLASGARDPWNQVVAVIVCLTVATENGGVSTSPTNNSSPRCPSNAAEAEAGLNLVATTTDGRIYRTFSQVFTIRARAAPSPAIL